MSLLMLVLQVCAAYRDPLIYETELKLKCMKTNIATLARFSMNFISLNQGEISAAASHLYFTICSQSHLNILRQVKCVCGSPQISSDSSLHLPGSTGLIV